MKPKIRKIIFWDIDYSTLDWNIHQDFIIKRVFERGSLDEISELYKFYKKEQLDKILDCLDDFSDRIKSFILLYHKKTI